MGGYPPASWCTTMAGMPSPGGSVAPSPRDTSRFASLIGVPETLARTLGVVFLLGSPAGVVVLLAARDTELVEVVSIVALAAVGAVVGLAMHRGALDGRSIRWVSCAFGLGTVLITAAGLLADPEGVGFRYFYLWLVPLLVTSVPRRHLFVHLSAMVVASAAVPIVHPDVVFHEHPESWVAATATIVFGAAASRGALASLVSLEGRVGRAFSDSPIGMALLSIDGEFLDINRELARMLRRDRADVVGTNVSETTHPDHLDHLLEVVGRTFENPGSVAEMEKRCVTGDGSLLWSRLTITRLDDLVFTQVQDVTAERALADGPLHDEVTGLPSRGLAIDRLATLLEPAAGSGDVAVVVVDIDGFGAVNDSFGHDAGDRMLRAVAERFLGMEPSPHTVARLGGDEFVLLFRNLDHPSAALAAAEATRASLVRPIHRFAGSMHVTVDVCAGIAVAAPGSSASGALRDALTAMHRAQASGPGSLQMFDQAMRHAASSRLGLEQELRDAIDDEHFSLDYQVAIDQRSGRIFGAEALVRWEHPDGRRMPDSFIPLAERTGLIVPLGRWVLRSAIHQAAEWRFAGVAPEHFRVSFNVSARQVDDPDRLLGDLATELSRHPGAAGAVAIELTETVLAESPRVPYLLEECRALGVSVLLDDFGTGYSSFGALRNYPVDYLKIDRSFVEKVADDGADTAIVRAMIDMARALGISVIAEGVETSEQREALAALGCHLIQGYLVHRASSPGDVTSIIRGRTLH